MYERIYASIYIRIVTAFLLISALPFLGFLISKSITSPFQYFDIFALIEFFIIFPYSLLNLYILENFFRESKEQQPANKKLYHIFFILLIISIFGLGMHLAANQIHERVDSEQVYFFDEIAGHLLFFVPSYLMTAMFMFVLPLVDSASKRPEILLQLTIGALQGILTTLSALEAQTADYAVVALAASLALLLFYKKIQMNPLAVYFISYIATVTITILVWIVYFGGLVQPSQIL